MTKISIVTISYNQGSFLEKTISSVLGQDYPEVEYIIVDPGSTDGSRQVIEKYRSRLSHVVFEPDQGPSDGLNKGFHLASGEIFGFINSDDYYLPSALKRVAKFFQDCPDVDVVSGNALVVNERGDYLRKIYSDRFSLFWSAYGCSYLIQPSSFIRAAAFLKTGGFNLENSSNWDDELFVDLKMNHAKFYNTKDFYSAYRVHHNSITGAGRLDAKIKSYAEKRFMKIMGRRRKTTDIWLGHLLRIYVNLSNPLRMVQRLLYGPVYKRYFMGRKE